MRSSAVRCVRGECVEEAVFVLGAAIQDDADVGVARGPEIFEQRICDGLGEWSGAVAKQVERLAQGAAPELIPSGPAAVAAAIGAPALYAMSAAPGAVVEDLGLPSRRKALEELAVVREHGVVVLLDPVHRVTECHLAVTMMMSIALAVGSNVCELRLVGRLIGAEAADQALAEVFTGVQQAFKGDGARCRTVVEEHRDGAAFVEFHEVRTRRIDRGVGGFDPGDFIVAGAVRARSVEASCRVAARGRTDAGQGW